MEFTLGSVEVEFFRRAGIVSVFNKRWNMQSTAWASFHLGVYPCMSGYYKQKGDGEVHVTGYWVWGRATEEYDHNGEYFGLGPLLLVCW